MAGAFPHDDVGPFGPPRQYKKHERQRTPLTRTQQQLWLMLRFGTGDTARRDGG